MTKNEIDNYIKEIEKEKGRKFPGFKEIVVNIIGVIFSEYWEAENLLQDIINTGIDLDNKMEQFEEKSEKFTKLGVQFKSKLDTIRDLFEAIPIKKTDKENMQ